MGSWALLQKSHSKRKPEKRLNLNKYTLQSLRTIKSGQFQYGSIKSIMQYSNDIAVNTFQFQYGSIKSNNGTDGRGYKPQFQFQNGTIKSFY